MSKTIIYDLTTQELEDQLRYLGQPNFRLKQIHQGIYNKLYATFDEFDNIPKDLRT